MITPQFVKLSVPGHDHDYSDALLMAVAVVCPPAVRCVTQSGRAAIREGLRYLREDVLGTVLIYVIN